MPKVPERPLSYGEILENQRREEWNKKHKRQYKPLEIRKLTAKRKAVDERIGRNVDRIRSE